MVQNNRERTYEFSQHTLQGRSSPVPGKQGHKSIKGSKSTAAILHRNRSSASSHSQLRRRYTHFREKIQTAPHRSHDRSEANGHLPPPLSTSSTTHTSPRSTSCGTSSLTTLNQKQFIPPQYPMSPLCPAKSTITEQHPSHLAPNLLSSNFQMFLIQLFTSLLILSLLLTNPPPHKPSSLQTLRPNPAPAHHPHSQRINAILMPMLPLPKSPCPESPTVPASATLFSSKTRKKNIRRRNKEVEQSAQNLDQIYKGNNILP